MTDSEPNQLGDLLSSFALGPAWARAQTKPQEGRSKHIADDGETTRHPRESRDRGDRDRRGGERDFRDRGGNRSGGGNFRHDRRDHGGSRHDDRRQGRPEEAAPAPGVHVSLVPTAEAIHLIGKEIHQVARVYPLFDVAQILLAERARCYVTFEVKPDATPLLRGTKDDSLFLTREEALAHLWSSPLKAEFLDEETIAVDPPTGNFQVVARCGMSGEWLGPPNFHSYQTNLRRLHRERFANMPFEKFSARVRTERGEEAVNAWLETMKNKTRWRVKGDSEEAWIEDRAEAERALAARCFGAAFEETRAARLPGDLKAKNLSPALLTSLKLAAGHLRKHPAVLIPAVCRAVEAEHLPVFKRQGKLFTGPARPHPLPKDAVLAERPGIMVGWIRENKPAKLEGLWKAVLPEGATAPPAEFAADLFWLLVQGHVLLFTDDTLVVQEIRDTPPLAAEGEGTAKKKKKKKKKTEATTSPTESTPDASVAEIEEADETDAPVSEENPPESTPEVDESSPV